MKENEHTHIFLFKHDTECYHYNECTYTYDFVCLENNYNLLQQLINPYSLRNKTESLIQNLLDLLLLN